jgi:hypothetical protein
VPWRATEVDLAAELSGTFADRFTNLRVLHVVRGAVNLAERAVADRALLAALEELLLAERRLGVIACVGERGYDRFAATEMLRYSDAVVGFDGAREDDSEAGVSLTFSSALHAELAKAEDGADRAESGAGGHRARGQVSVLLFTVTFHANHAHNLTRSP